MRVSSLIQRSVISCTIHDHLERAAELMWTHGIGCLPVVDEQGHVAGMVTDRDICMATYTQVTRCAPSRCRPQCPSMCSPARRTTRSTPSSA